MFNQILLVDDNETDQFINARRIRQHDESIALREAQNGLEAMAVLREPDFWPDLILLDVNMPVLDGFGFLDAYMAEFADRPVNIVLALTSAYQDNDVRRAEAYPVVKGQIIKPLSKDWCREISALC
ncbi:MAG: response regulator [Gammaproteobacteria bacterium]